MARKRKRKGLWITVAIIILAVFGISMLSVLTKQEQSIAVSVDTVGQRTITQSVNTIGRLHPEVMVKVSSETSGEIIFLGVRDGDAVRKGQLLARIQPDIVQTQLEQVRAAVDASQAQVEVAKTEMVRSEADYKRVAELARKDFASREELDRARASFESAVGRHAAARSEYRRNVASLSQAQASASRTTLFSPLDGTVTYLAVEQGEKVVGTAQMQGTEMMRIADLSTMNAWVDVNESDIASIHVGDTARVRVDALGEEVFRGVIYEIGNSARVSAQGTQEEVVNFQVRIRLLDKSPKMRPGMSVDVDIETHTNHNVLAIPTRAVTARSVQADVVREDEVESNSDIRKRGKTETYVWVVSDGVVADQVVEMGIADREYIEVLSGLKEGQVVVTAPFEAVTRTLSKGKRVTVETPEARRQRLRTIREQS